VAATRRSFQTARRRRELLALNPELAEHSTRSSAARDPIRREPGDRLTGNLQLRLRGESEARPPRLLSSRSLLEDQPEADPPIVLKKAPRRERRGAFNDGEPMRRGSSFSGRLLAG
jgi:hypothetical protein